MASNGVEWRLQAVQFDSELDSESVAMERGVTGTRFDRPCSDADSDAHNVGYPVAKGVNVVGARELFTPEEIAMPNKLHTPAMVGKRADGLQSSWVDSWLRLTSRVV